jgi:hypothetical protein
MWVPFHGLVVVVVAEEIDVVVIVLIVLGGVIWTSFIWWMVIIGDLLVIPVSGRVICAFPQGLNELLFQISLTLVDFFFLTLDFFVLLL